ncbi:MAG TPA: hypothetical protein PL059_13630 [Spirochaetota bacterium]|nr:hypothetical protein [Spirochaetota bacterium]HOM10719.1 hypothetical protein [Spirochaetota bacterium]HPP51062.1 hypothetical protein [Spirochaetota bacterium]
MRKLYLIIFIIASMIVTTGVFSQETKKDSLESEALVNEGKELDQQILTFCKRIEETIAKYKLMSIKDIRLLPFQISYSQGNDYIYLEKHFFVKDDLVPNKIKIKKLKSIKIYTNGTTVSKLESIIREENYYENTVSEVKIIDPTPTSLGTDDIVFSYIRENKVILTEKRLSEVKNSTAFPIQNQLKREFYIPHLMYFYDVLLNIAETYYKGMKDVDSTMTEFLKDSTKYY